MQAATETQQPRQADMVVTSENLAEFAAKRLGLAADDAPAEAVEGDAPEAEPAVEANSESESDNAEEKASPTEEKKQNPKLEKRFSELTKQREQARQEAAREREAREALEARLKALESKNQPNAQADALDQEPKPEQFQDAFEYAKALAEFSAERALQQRDKQEAEAKAQAERDKVLKTWSDRIQATKAELPDFDAMVASSEVAVSDAVRDAILESEAGPKILYHLAENPEVAEKIAGLSTVSALREIGKLEARFETKEEPKRKDTVAARSKAPAPISPLKASGKNAEVSVDHNGEFHGTYAQWREARNAGRIR